MPNFSKKIEPDVHYKVKKQKNLSLNYERSLSRIPKHSISPMPVGIKPKKLINVEKRPTLIETKKDA